MEDLVMSSWAAALLALTMFGTPNEGVILQFSKSDCAPCRQLQPSVDQLVSEGWIVRSVNVDREADFAQRWQITQLPTLIVVQNGREVDRIVGAMPLDRLRDRLNQTANRPSEVASPAQAAEPRLASSQFAANPSYDNSAPQANMSDNATLASASASASASAPTSASGPIIRGQSPLLAKSAAAAVTSAAAITNSLNATGMSRSSVMSDPQAATVRIKVDDGKSEAFGTGTIIDTHSNEALVLTCGHLFRDGQGQSPMTVDVWVDGQKLTYPAKLVHYQADETDIGLIAFAADRPMKSAAVLPQGIQVGERQTVFSYGCDGGADPTRRDTMVTKLNRYLGPSNIEISGAPIQGRSGGGLFDEQGHLIGVCYAADKELDEGLYAGPEVIYQALAHINMSHLYQPRNAPVQLASTQQPDSRLQANTLAASTASSDQPSRIASGGQGAPDEDWNPANSRLGANAPQANAAATGAQVVAIVREPGQPERTIHISNASPSLIQMIQQHDGNAVRR
jgi:thiol-disulfide isomerase/thioredoxin